MSRTGSELTGFGELLCQLSLQQLSGRTFGNVFDNADRLGTFVIGQPFAAIADEIIFRYFRSIFKNHEGGDLFAIQLIGNTDRGCGCHGGMLIEDFVDLTRDGE